MKTSLAPGSKVVTEYFEKAGLTPFLEAARLPHGRLRLHDVHRQLRPAARGGLDGDRRRRPRRLRRALRQPELRGAHPPRGEGELPRLTSARRRLRARRGAWTSTCSTEPLGHDPNGDPVFLADIWPAPAEVRGRRSSRRSGGEMFRATYADVFDGRSRVARAADARRRASTRGTRTRPTSGGRRTSTGWPPSRGTVADIAGARCLVVARRLGHDRPHLPGRLDQARLARRPVPGRARRRAQGLQLLRLAPRQPRGDGARHVRERAAAQPARARAPRARGRCTCPTARR